MPLTPCWQSRVERLRQAAERLWAERQPEERADPAPERKLPPPSVIVGALLERARSLAAMEEAPVAEMEHLMRALTEPGSEIAPLLERFGVGLGNLRAALAWAPEVRAVAAELARSQTLKEDAIRSRDYEVAALHRENQKYLKERYQLLRTILWGGVVHGEAP